MANELALVDVAEDKLMGEMMDLQHGQAFTKRVVIKASKGQFSTSKQSNKDVDVYEQRPPGTENTISLINPFGRTVSSPTVQENRKQQSFGLDSLANWQFRAVL